jgi:hypothetical protein
MKIFAASTAAGQRGQAASLMLKPPNMRMSSLLVMQMLLKM